MEHYKSKIKEMYNEIYDDEEDIYNNDITIDEYDTLVGEEPYVEEPYVEEPYVEEPYVEEPYVDEYNNRTEDEENEIIDANYWESRPNWIKGKEKIEEAVDVKKIIDDVIDTNWSKDNESQMKILQLLKGIATSNEDAANKFMVEIDKFTSSLKKEDYK